MDTDILKEFDEICARLNIDHLNKANAIEKYKEVTQNTILDGNPLDWLCCALWTSCNKMILTVVGNVIQGNGVSFAKLLQVCNLSIFSFFVKIETWFKVSSVPNAMNHRIEHLKRSFRVSQLIYNEFSSLFAKVFICNDTSTDGDNEQPKSAKSRRKTKNIPYTSQQLFEMCWSMFVCVKSEHPDKSTDLVSSVNMLLCCLDLIFTNVVHDNRRDLINSSFTGLPKGFFSPSWDESKSNQIDMIEKLCDNRNQLDEVRRVKTTKWEPVMRKYTTTKLFQGAINEILSVENFEKNFKKVNDIYETYILSCGQFDERVFLSHSDFGSKTFGRSLHVSNPADNQTHGASLMPQTPLSGQDFLHQPSNKLSPISSCKQNVQKLQALYNGQRGPTDSLKEILSISCPESILDSLKARLSQMEEIFNAKISCGQERFQYAEALYYRLLESIIKSEMKTHGRFDLFIDDDIFNQTLIVLCLEIVLFAFSLHKELTTLLECFQLEPFHFYKLIEVAIRNNKEFFTNDIIKHLKAVEEQCLDSLSWASGSVLWEKISEHKGKLPASQDVEVPLSQQTNGGSQSPNGNQLTPNSSQTSPKSLRLFFRKYYQLAHLRLKDLCKNLQFSNNSELLRKIWTLFEFAVIEHTDLMKDRHLDQILMCCVYVLCKIRSNENRHTFADIMKFYRNQPQADSHIYRSVFIEYVRTDNANETDQQGSTRKKVSAAEPEVVSGRNTIYGTESRGDIILFYNKIFVPKMQQFAMRFSTSSSQNNLLLSPLPHARPTTSPRKIWPYHDVYVQPLVKVQSVLSPSATSFTFTVEQSPSKDLQKINNLINNRKTKQRFNLDCVPNYPPSKMAKKDSSLQLLISDREDLSN